MGFTKIEESDLIGKLVSELPDIPEMTADELKKWFDSLAKDVIIPRFNQLSKELDDSGISNSVKAENVKYIRVNDDKQLEYSEDGKKYETIGSSGHLIVDEDGNELPTRGRIKFAEELEVSDSEETNETIVRKAGIDYSELEFDTNEVVVEDQENERTIISDAYSTKTPYSVDDYCIYADVLYRCIAETSGAFDATCWEKTLVASELKQLSSNMTWQLVGTTTGTNSITLPDDFKEIMVLTRNTYNYKWIILKEELSTERAQYVQGFNNSSQNFHLFVITESTVELSAAMEKGSNVVDATSITVWSR